MIKAIIRTAVAPLFPEPAENRPLSDEVLHGMVVDVLESRGDGWLYVETPYKYRGYARERHFVFGGAEEWEDGDIWVVIGSFADVLSEPGVKSVVIKNLTRSCAVKMIGDKAEGAYARIGLADGRSGYIHSKSIEKKAAPYDYTRENAFRARVLQTAESYIGTPYRWGGKTPLGIDCSGLCSTAYMLNGVYIYRDAQIKDGFPVKEIRLGSLKPADLLFFPGHMAMYAGNGRLIHSSVSNNGVYYNSLNKSDKDYRKDLSESEMRYGSIF